MSNISPISLDADTLNRIAADLPTDAILRQGEGELPPVREPPEEARPQPEATAPEPEPAPDLEPEPEPAPEAAAPPTYTPPAPPPERALSDAEWQRWEFYRQLDDRLNADAEFRQAFETALQPAAAPQPYAPYARTPEAEPTFEDPALAALQARLDAMSPVVAKWDAYLNHQATVEARAVESRAQAAFKARYNLSDDQVATVAKNANAYAAALPHLYASGMDQQAAVERLYENAYWGDPETRKAQLAQAAAQHAADEERKAKAGSLSGSSGSGPRVSTNTRLNEQERREAISRAISEGVSE